MSKKRLTFALVAGLAIMTAAAQVVNDSPGVTVDLGGAAVMHRTGVAYPAAALKQGVQGTVVVEVKLDASGNVADARVVSGPDELRNAALQSVLQWHLMKNLAGSSRQVSISFRTPEVSAGVAGGVTGGASAGVLGGIIASAPTPWAGRTVRIDVVGLSDESRANLLSQLPVHDGGTLSIESFQNVIRVVKEFDEHLSFAVMTTGSNEVTLRIMAPGGTRTAAATGIMTATLPAPSAGDYATPPGRIRVGGGVQQTKLVSQPRPTYPLEAKQARIQGVVKLSAIIGKDGAIQHLEVVSGHPLLIPSALDAVRQWVYQPTLLNGQPVEVMTDIDVNYTLAQ
jgi:TonB family protein